MDHSYPNRIITYRIYDFKSMTPEQINRFLDTLNKKLDRINRAMDRGYSLKVLRSYHSLIMTAYYLFEAIEDLSEDMSGMINHELNIKKLKTRLGITDQN